MAELGLNVVIQAQDQASQALAQVEQNLTRVTGRVSQSQGALAKTTDQASQSLQTTVKSSAALNTSLHQLDLGAGRTARGLRLLLLPALDLSPAMGTLSSRIAGVVASAALLGTGLGALALAASGLAGVVISQLVQSWRQAADQARKFNEAVTTLNAGLIEQQSTLLLGRLADIRDQVRQTEAEIAKIDPRKLEQLQGPLSPRRRLERLRQQEREIAGQAELLSIAQVPLLQLELAKKSEAERKQRAEQLEKDLESIRSQGLQKMAEQELLAFGDLDEVLRERGKERWDFQLELRKMAQEEFNRLGAEEVKAWEGFEKEKLTIISERIERQKMLEVEAANIEEQVRQQIVEFHQIGADAATRAALDLEAIERRREDRLRQISLIEDDNLRRVQTREVETEATVARARIQFEEAVRTDPFAGMRQGLQETADEFLSFGGLMRDGTRRMGEDMARHFSDTFVSTVTGDFKKLQDLPKQFALNTLRVFGDVLGRIQAGFILQAVRGAFPGLGAFLPGVTTGAPPGAITLAAGQSVPAGFTAISTAAGGGTVAVQTGGGGGTGLPLLPLAGLPPPSFLSNFLSTPLFAASFGAGSVAVPAAGITGVELLGSTPGVIPATSLPAFTLGQALGVAGGVAGLGLTVFSALQQPPSVMNFATSAVSGALSGALIGAQFGLGPVGAVAGGLIGGIASLFGRGRRQSREPQEIARGQAAANADVARVAAATTSLELATAVRIATHQAYGGPAGRGTNPSTAGFAVFVGGEQFFFGPVNSGQVFPGALERFAELIVAQPETFQARIQLGVNEGAKAQINQALEQAVRAKAEEFQSQRRQEEERQQRLAAGAREIPIAFEEEIIPGLTLRRTILTAADRELARGRDLLTLPKALIRQRVDPDLAEELLRQLAEVDRDRRLGILSREVF